MHRKGVIVIPAEVRRRFGIVEGSHLELVVDDDGIRLIVPRSLEEAFGVDGEKALEVVRLIAESRRAEVEEKTVRS